MIYSNKVWNSKLYAQTAVYVCCSFGVVVCDESHALKSHSAKRTQFLWPVVQRAKRAILITGTPALSRPIELFPQVSSDADLIMCAD